jgi:hypothetical protein
MPWGSSANAIAPEGALLGGLSEKGFALDLAILSDGAGQVAILLHARCWVHAERLARKLIGERAAAASAMP